MPSKDPSPEAAALAPRAARGYADLHEHLEELRKRGLLITIDRPIDKDAELHPLVRWQFVGGLEESERKAFLFTNVTDGRGRGYPYPVAVGAIAANPAIYSIGMGVPVDRIGERWERGIAHPIPPRLVERAVCQEIVHEGTALQGEGNGLDRLPIPISTPGYDAAPTLTATNVVTRDPETGVQNMGTYRAALKAPDRLVVRMATRVGGAGGYQHYLKCQRLGRTTMPCAIVLGCPPYVAFVGPQKLALGLDELDVAGGLAGEPIHAVKCRSVDLLVPAESEIVIEGLIDTGYCEPEAPFGESHGHVALEEFNMPMRITAITHRRDPIIASYISQVTPSESSVIKRVAYEPLFLAHLRDALGIRQVRRVSFHEPLTGLRRIVIVTLEKGAPRPEVWRALNGAAFFRSDTGKVCIAVNEDIDPDNADALLWAVSYRAHPVEDMQVLLHRGLGHGPRRERGGGEDATLLIDATMKGDMPPLALPAKQYMERARGIWEELGLPALHPRAPWHGYSLGDWLPQWDEAAQRAVQGRYLENGRISERQRRKGVKPETKFRPGGEAGGKDGD
jgi:4-hydroxy-3-polyprenylbenzoate decarboxylase